MAALKDLLGKMIDKINKIPTRLSQLEIDLETGVKSWNDLEDRPFYEHIISDGVDFTWDGTIGDMPVYNIVYRDMEHAFIKVSDFVPTENDARVVSGTMYSASSLSNDFEISFSQLAKENGYFYYANMFPTSGEMAESFVFFITTEEGASTLGFPEIGTYVNYIGDALDRLNVRYYFKKLYIHEEKTLIQLDEKFIPDTIARKSDIVGDEEVPEYWISHLDSKVDLIWKAMESAGRNKSAFFFYSDAHWWAKDRNDEGVTWEHSYTTKTEPVLLKYLYNNTPINKTNFGGDIIGEEAYPTTESGRKAMSYIKEWRKALRELPNHHSVPGNHDDGNEIDNRFTDEFVYSYLLAPEETHDIVQGEEFYYYIDNPCEKTRYIYLDTAYKGITDAQTEFVKEALLSTLSGWHIVAIAHKWYDTNYNTNPVSTGAISTEGATLLAMFDAYNARTGEYADGKGKVEFCIGGHTHWDHVGKSNGGIPVILCESSSLNDRSGLNPVAGTITETAVSAIVANYNTNKINVIRIGRGSSFEVNILTGESGEFDPDYIEPFIPSGEYTNVLLAAVDSDGSSITSGYKEDNRVSNSSGFYAVPNVDATGWISCKVGDIIRLYNVKFDNSHETGHPCVAIYNAVELNVANSYNYTEVSNTTSAWNPVLENGNVVEFRIPDFDEFTSEQLYFRICADDFNKYSIITINEDLRAENDDNDNTETTYTNVLLTAVNSDGSDIAGGYKESNRISGSSGFSGATGCDATGWIACNKGDVIRFYNMTFDLSGGTTNPSIALYPAVQLSVHGIYNYSTLTESGNAWNTVLDGSNIIQVTVPNYSELTASPIYFRVCADDINENTIITINEEIN